MPRLCSSQSIFPAQSTQFEACKLPNPDCGDRMQQYWIFIIRHPMHDDKAHLRPLSFRLLPLLSRFHLHQHLCSLLFSSLSAHSYLFLPGQSANFLFSFRAFINTYLQSYLIVRWTLIKSFSYTFQFLEPLYFVGEFAVPLEMFPIGIRQTCLHIHDYSFPWQPSTQQNAAFWHLHFASRLCDFHFNLCHFCTTAVTSE